MEDQSSGQNSSGSPDEERQARTRNKVPKADRPPMPDEETLNKRSLEAINLEQHRKRTRIIPESEIIFDEEGLPYISLEDLETTCRTLQLFYRYPEVASAATYKRESFEFHVMNAIRSNALRWLRPTDAPAVKDIIRLLKVQDTQMVQCTGIRNERNRKKKMLPIQCGQVLINTHHDQLALQYTKQEEEKLLLKQSVENDEVSTTFTAATTASEITTRDAQTSNNNTTKSQESQALASAETAPASDSTTIITLPSDAQPDTSSPDGIPRPVHDADTQAVTRIPLHLQQNVTLHGVKVFTTLEEIPDEAKIHSKVLDSDSTAVLGPDGRPLPLAAIKTNFVPIKKSEIRNYRKGGHVAGNSSDTMTDDGDGTQNSDDLGSQYIPKKQRTEDMASAHPSSASRDTTMLVKTTITLAEDDSDDMTGNIDVTAPNTSDSVQPSSECSSMPLRQGNKSFYDLQMDSDATTARETLTILPRNPNTRHGKTKESTWEGKEGIYGGSRVIPSTVPSSMEESIDGDGDGDDASTSTSTSAHVAKPVIRDTTRASDIQQHAQKELDEKLKEDTFDATNNNNPLTMGLNEVFPNTNRTLRKPRQCYICKAHYKTLHHFYDQMCPPCAEFNYRKRYQTADMTVYRPTYCSETQSVVIERIPRVCLVTGARVKIGYEITLKLLRAGAMVIATSRFPKDTAIRLSLEDDFHLWKHNIHVYGLDFRVISGVEMFVQHLLRTYDRLDVIINNAAQTIRRPPQFYRHLIDVENKPLSLFSDDVQLIVKDYLPPDVRDEAREFTRDMMQAFGVSQKVIDSTNLLMDYSKPQQEKDGVDDCNDDITIASSTEGNRKDLEAEGMEDHSTTLATAVDPQNTMEDKDSPTTVDGSDTVAAADMKDQDQSSSKAPDTTTPDRSNNPIIPLLVPEPNNATSTALANLQNDHSANSRFVTMLSLPQTAVVPASLLTQIPLLAEDFDNDTRDEKIYPVGVYDKDNQQIDLRTKQTWVLKASEVSTIEMTEVQLVNSMTPFIFATKLQPLMERCNEHRLDNSNDISTGDYTCACFIVNVSSMEGKFRGHKNITHPHTNMAKAALNMFTHTSSRDFAHQNIFMNAVDTGWVTEELPYAIAVVKAQDNFQPPLDEIDGAARVLDPVFKAINTNCYEFGKFFKDYREAHW